MGTTLTVMVRRYWRFVAAVAASLALVIYLPSPRHRAVAGTSSESTAISLPAGVTPPAPPGTPGLTAGGVTCGPGVRQIPTSAYADICVPAWSGDNGGTTSHGVTGTTITLSYRLASTPELTALYSLIPESVVGTNDEAIAALNGYVDYFNKHFELYGRHVVLKPFTGQGNFIEEDAGLGAPTAQADALTAYDNGAFSDMSLIDSSEMYVTDLANEKVVAFSLYVEPKAWYSQYAPFEYTTGPDCDKEANAVAAVLAKAVAGMPATDVGAALAGKPVRIGIIYPQTGQNPLCAQLVQNELAKRYGITPAVVQGFTFDLSKLQSQGISIMAEMQSQGITDVVCSSCDPVTPQFLIKSAVADGYYPQWIVVPAFALAGSDDEAFVRLLPESEISHVVQLGTAVPPRDAQEAYSAYRAAGVNGPLDPTYPFLYAQLMMFFNALQAAGPYLTPQTFEHGVFASSNSASRAEFGAWNPGNSLFDPQDGFSILHWSNAATSNQDGQKGAFLLCNGGATYLYTDTGLPSLPDRSPLSCPGGG